MNKLLVSTLIIATILVSFLISAGCTAQSTPLSDANAISLDTPPDGPGTISVIDMANRTVEVKKEPQRIIGVGAGALRMIAYLQAADLVVGVDDREQKKYETSGFGMPSGIDKPYNLANP
ncbi:MAG: hypothetical protein Q7J03_03330, partial [Methanoregula sp.]|nr:hypothetical protein [Methanoregula sp.]